jgi:hypothetical protein
MRYSTHFLPSCLSRRTGSAFSFKRNQSIEALAVASVLTPSWLRVRQVIFPALALFLIDLVVAAVFFGYTRGYWLFKNTNNWVQVAAVLTFTEAVICFLIGGLSGAGVGEHSAIRGDQRIDAPFDIEQHQSRREKTISLAFQLAAIGLVLILLTMLLYFESA